MWKAKQRRFQQINKANKAGEPGRIRQISPSVRSGYNTVKTNTVKSLILAQDER